MSLLDVPLSLEIGVPMPTERAWPEKYRAPRPSMAHMLDDFLADFCPEIEAEAIRSARRDREVAWARQAFMAYVYKLGNRSLPDIGRFLDRDHTTVLYGIRAHNARMAETAPNPINQQFVARVP